MVMKLFAYLAFAALINVFAFLMKSDFIHTFPGADFLAMLVTIMAINTATSSYIVSKLEDLANKAQSHFDFSPTYRQIKLSLLEQVVLIIVSFLILIMRSSEYFKTATNTAKPYAAYYSFATDVVLTWIFVIVIGILWDTGKSIFALITKPPKK